MAAPPKYRQIYELFRTQITAGRYPAGEALPSENELARAHHATRPTVRKALGLLAAEGFIVKHQGKESVVKGAPKGIGILSITGTTSAVGHGNFLTHIIFKPVLRQWTEAFSFPISEAEQKAGCFYFERLRVLEGKPVFLDVTMLPNIKLPHFTAHSLENRSLFNFLRAKYQIEVTGGTQQLFAIRADKRLQKHLQVKAGFPVLQLNRKIETTRQDFHIYSQVFCATQTYWLTGTF